VACFPRKKTGQISDTKEKLFIKNDHQAIFQENSVVTVVDAVITSFHILELDFFLFVI